MIIKHKTFIGIILIDYKAACMVINGYSFNSVTTLVFHNNDVKELILQCDNRIFRSLSRQSSVSQSEGSEDQPVSALKYQTSSLLIANTVKIKKRAQLLFTNSVCFFPHKWMQMDDFKYISVLGRGHFGKVTAF